MINFATIKQLVTARQAAQCYGLRVDARGMALCPFHDDHNPSLKLDERYYCFGCGVRGDSISFTAQFFGLSQASAARKLAVDFGIDPEGYDPIPVKSPARQAFDQWVHDALKVLRRYNQLLIEWKSLAPSTPGEDFHFLFVEALLNQSRVQNLMCTLAFGTPEEKQDIYHNCREEVNRIHERIQAYDCSTCTQAAETQ